MHRRYALALALIACLPAFAAQRLTVPVSTRTVTATEVAARLDEGSRGPAPPAVIWLKPVEAAPSLKVTPGKFTLLQKNKMFTPHLLVVPVGSSVAFPNEDPFFHDVFSLFDGRRFDLGLYEAGSTRSEVFSREGVSYIFCNIHSAMSAVVVSLATPYYAVADRQGGFRIRDVPAGDYDLHVWVEGQRAGATDPQPRRIHIAAGLNDLGSIHADREANQKHLNKFGKPYEPDPEPIY